IFRLSRREKHIVVFDEFQRLLEIDRGALSILQRIIDEEAHGCQLMLICTGSSIGMMERIYNYGQPLYGRATGFLKIKPFDFQATYRYLAMRLGVSPVNAVAIYGVFGGTPYYLSMLSSGDWLREAERLIFDYRSPLYLEPELLLKTELREHVTYFEILRLLASGKSTFSEIAGSLGASKTSLSYYLNVLIRDLDLVARDEPIGGGRAVYRIKDNFFRFWFRYVFPNRSMLELGERGEVLEKVREDFNTYMGLVFQDIARQQVWRLSLPFKPYRVGGWWRKGVEIDVVAVDRSGRKAILMEVKWRDIGLNEAERILFELEDKGKYLGYPVKYYGLIARRIEDKERLLKSGYLAFSIDDLVSG
ncbi:MAG: ATP-binding protein, partial [Thermoprotei archaeon]